MLTVEQVARHESVSHAIGGDRVRLTIAGSTIAVTRRWRARFEARELAFDPTTTEHADGSVRLDAAIYPYLPSHLIIEALEAARVSPALRRQLDTFAGDAWQFWRGGAIHHAIASGQGWPALHWRLGAETGTLLGMGEHAVRLVRNVPEHIGAPLVIAGRDKAAARDLLMAAGVPIVEGRVVGDADAAAQWSRGRTPVVVKPTRGGNGEDVVVGLSDPEDVRAVTARLLCASNPFVVIERFVAGVEMRVHVIAGSIASVRRSADVTVMADGSASIAELIAVQRPDVWTATRAVPWLQRRLIALTWHLGVRRVADLARVAPAVGPVRVGGSDRSEALATEALHVDDRDAIEWLFGRYGPASGGLDVMVAELGAPMRDGGGVIDLNVPCGIAYLGADVPQLAAREFEAWLPTSFRLASGRVPLYLTLGSEVGAIEAEFRRRHPGGVTTELDDRGWGAVFDRPEASALLVRATTERIDLLGIPINTHPELLTSDRDFLTRASSEVMASVVNAGGAVVTPG